LPLFKINDPLTTFPIMTFAASTDSIFALRVQKPNSRAVMLGINPFVILDQTIRENLIYRSVAWIQGTLSDVNDNHATNELFEASASPNPFTDNVNVQINLKDNSGNTIDISVVNEIGQTVKTYSAQYITFGKQTIELDMCGLNSGKYFILLKSGNNSVSLPVVKL
jgi:hypothetical protein